MPLEGKVTKRSKKIKRQSLAVPQAGDQRSISRLAIVTVLLIAAPVLWWWHSKTPEVVPAKSIANASIRQFEKLVGGWQRPDGGYVLALNSIASDGAVAAAYYNPNTIHVAKAEASGDGDALKVFIELRDVNYPGSTYTLTYDPASDQLKGVYYQAVEKQQFPVAFLRMK